MTQAALSSTLLAFISLAVFIAGSAVCGMLLFAASNPSKPLQARVFLYYNFVIKLSF